MGHRPHHGRHRGLASRPHIHLPGYVDREHALGLLRHAEVFVLASEVEGIGLPLAEAISCATPSVASDIPALREAGGQAALFAPPGDPAALAAAIDRALVFSHVEINA